jgi:hypothetical protein
MLFNYEKNLCLMKTRSLLSLLLICLVFCTFSSCVARKQGCPSNGKNVGAERVLTGEKKLPKAKKFKA